MSADRPLRKVVEFVDDWFYADAPHEIFSRVADPAPPVPTGPTSDTPFKGFNYASGFSTVQRDRLLDRNELRFNMHGKISVLPYAGWMSEFFPSSNFPPITTLIPMGATAPSAVFSDIAMPKTENEMYNTLVS